MEYLNQLGKQYTGLSTILESIFGIAWFVFGSWRYLPELRAPQALKENKLELLDSSARLGHVKPFSSAPKNYSVAV
jgi:hypothetical protein